MGTVKVLEFLRILVLKLVKIPILCSMKRLYLFSISYFHNSQHHSRYVMIKTLPNINF